MYEEFYGLRSKPFQLNPDPEFYFGSKQHRRAKSYLDYGVLRNEGFIVVTGEIGAGKTTLVRGLLDSLEASKVVAAQLVSTQLDAEDMLRLVGAAFGVQTKNVSKADLLMALEVFFVSQVGQGRRCLLVVDEAQNLTTRAVEELRMLSNFQFGKQALLQSFLVGQPEFRRILQDPRMQQLRQRVIAACHIGPLDLVETQDYISHRLKVSGASERPVFKEPAIEAIFRLSEGIPRKINVVCDRLLLLGFLENKFVFDYDDVEQIEKEINEENGKRLNFSETEVDQLNRKRNSSSDVETGPGIETRFKESSLDEDQRWQRMEERILRIERTNVELLTAIRQVASDSAELAKR